MRFVKHICTQSLRDLDRKIALLGASRLAKHNQVGFVQRIRNRITPTGSTRLVRHNRPGRVKKLSRKIAYMTSFRFIWQKSNWCWQNIKSKVAITGSTWLIRHNIGSRTPNTSRKIAVLASTMIVGGGALVVAQADESFTEFTRRAYIGIGGGATMLEPKTPNESLTVSSNTASGFHIVGGYDFTSRLSAELYYADLGSADIAFLGSEIGDIEYKVFGLSAIGYIYNSRSGFRARSQRSGMGTREGLSLFSRVGVGGISADSSNVDYKVNHSTHLALGLGAEYGFRNGFAVRGEYRALDTDQHYGSLSLVKRFGKVRSVLPVAAAALPAVSAPQVTAVPDVEPPEVVEDPPAAANFAGVPTINFAFDKSDISQLAATKLDEIATVLGSSNTNIVLEGHTDWIASESYNQKLSIDRAESVRRYLENRGVDRSRMAVRGFGETRPIAVNDTVEGRASNRRVDIRVN